MHALGFLFMLLVVFFLASTGAPNSEDYADYLSKLGSFVGGFFTPVLTVGAVWVAYKQLKDQRQVSTEKAEINYLSFMAKKCLENAEDTYKAFCEEQKNSRPNLKSLIDANMQKNPDLLSTRFQTSPQVKSQVESACITITRIRVQYQKASKIVGDLEQTDHKLHMNHIAAEEVYTARKETRKLIEKLAYLKPALTELEDTQNKDFSCFSNGYYLSQAIIALHNPDKE